MMMQGSDAPDRWTTVITPVRDRRLVDIAELLVYRDLIALFIKRDFITQYKQTILGPAWFLIQPLLTTAMFLVVFGKIANIPTDGVPQPLFYMGGLIVWNYFSGILTQTSSVLISNVHLFSKVYFPRLVVPIAQVVAGLGRFAIQFVLFAALYVFYLVIGMKSAINWTILLFPLTLSYVAILGFGVGLIISAFTTRYRDLQVGLSFLMQLWLYGSPIVYPVSLVPERWQTLYSLNPIIPAMESFKHIFFGTALPPLSVFGTGIAVTLLLLVIGLFFFNRVERTFIDTV
ncbi:MAG TPA: ABC transporter permease [bacterium]|nr:ABC transporter permease [bacterium]